MILALILAQAVGSLGLRLQDEGITRGYVDTLNMAGAGVACTVIGLKATCTISGGGGGGGGTPGGLSGNLQTNDGAGGFGAYAGTSCAANQYLISLNASGFRTCAQVSYAQLSGTPTIPTDVSGASYWTRVAEASLSNETALGSLATGILLNTTTTGVPTIYAGTSCSANQYLNALDASGVKTCAQVGTSQLSGTITDAQLANNYSGIGACAAGRFASTLNDNAAPTCTQVAYGDVSGTPSIPTDLSGEPYWTAAASANLSAEKNLGALSTGLVLNTSGTPSAYAGTSCAYAVKTLDASGASTCTSAPTIPADISGAHYVTTQAEAGLSAEAVVPTCSGTDKLTFNGTILSCAADVGGSASPGGSSGDVQVNNGSGGFSGFAGSSCPDGMFPTRVTSSGALVCVSPYYSTVRWNGEAPIVREPALNLLQGQNTYVSCADNPALGSTDCTIGSSIRFVEVSVNLGTSAGLVYTTTVVGQPWITSTSKITCDPFATSADGQTVETYFAAGLTATASNRVAASSFDLTVLSPNGATGTFRFHCTGGT